jgi:solute carrier family 6 (neurotransmitter transporter)
MRYHQKGENYRTEDNIICSQGIGVALLVSQALIGVYSVVGVSWMFIYFRDSFITKQDNYRWAEPYDSYREGE